MQLPIRNKLSESLTLFIEPECDAYEIPPGGMAVVTLDDGHPHSLDYYPDRWLSLWNESPSLAIVEVLSADERR